jgi:hypothetical protein
MQVRVCFALALGAWALWSAPLSASGRAEGSIRKTWDYPPGVTTVVVDADEQDIVVKAGGPRVTGRSIGDIGDDVKTSVVDGTLTITVRADRGWFAWKHRASRVELTVPDGLNLDLTTASGAVLVRVATQSLRVRSASGDIEAPRGGQGADVDTTSGTVRLNGFHGPVKATALSGNILLESIEGLVQASTLSGDIEAKDLSPADQSRFTAVSGDVRLKLTRGVGTYAIDAETSSGRLRIGDVEAETSLKTGTWALTIRTVSGDVLVQ